MLVGTRAVVLHATLCILAEGPETQQVFGGSALALSLVTQEGAVICFGLCILLCYTSLVQLALLAHLRLQQLQWLEGRVARVCWQALSALSLSLFLGEALRAG